MIQPKNNRFIRWFFHHYILGLVKRNFQDVRINERIPLQPDQAVLLLANHFSWWDGFLMYYLNQRLLHKKFHIMVLEDTVSRVSFFKYLGAFSINKNSRDVMTSLNYASSLLNDPENMVLIFPQGKLYSNFTDKLVFQKGVLKIMADAKQPFQLLLSASFVENFKYKKPEAAVYLKTLNSNLAFKNIDELTAVYQQHYDAAKQQQTQIIL